jgi:hypothetical protein
MDKPKFNVASEKVIIEFNHGEWWVMLDNGAISTHLTPLAALKEVQKAAKRALKDVTVTRIEWRNAPEGFVPPTGQER